MLNITTETRADAKDVLPVSTSEHPSYAIDASSLASMLDHYETLIVDMRSDITENEGHIPGAVRLDYNQLVLQKGNVEGLIPSATNMSKVLSSIGLKPWHFVVAHDDETGVEAARLLWTLACAGHDRYALLNGGYQAWCEGGFETVPHARTPEISDFRIDQYSGAIADKHAVSSSLSLQQTVLVDTRGSGEFSGEERRAERGGHIPGAVNFNWMEAIDMFGDGGLRDPDKLRAKLRAKGVTPDKDVIVYCQSNRRSAHTFVVLKWLGFENVRAYDGSWSEWGNDSSLPVETA